MIELVAVDIDGTLLDSTGRIPQANIDALARVARQGVRVVIATGRSFHFAMQALGALPGALTLVVYNGAIARTRDGRTLMRRLLPGGVARAVLETTRPWRPDAAAVFDRPLAGQLLYDRMDWSHPNRSGFHAKNHAIIQAVDELEDAVLEDPVQITFNGGVGQMRAVAAHLGGLAVAASLEISRTEYPDRDFSMVDVCAAGTNKGTGVAEVARLAGLGPEQVLAIGDNHNDRDMLAWAGTGVVMGNAGPELLAAGFHRTGTNDEAGLSQALERFVLSA